MTDTIALEKALNLYGFQVVSAGLEAEIPPEDIGRCLLAVMEGEQDSEEFDQFIEQSKIDHIKEVRIGETKFIFDGRK